MSEATIAAGALSAFVGLSAHYLNNRETSSQGQVIAASVWYIVMGLVIAAILPPQIGIWQSAAIGALPHLPRLLTKWTGPQIDRFLISRDNRKYNRSL